MMQNALTGQRILITQATEFMGPTLCEVFAEQGAQVVRSEAPLAPQQAAREVVEVADSGGFFTVHAAAVGALNRKLTVGQGRDNALYVLGYYVGAWFGMFAPGQNT